MTDEEKKEESIFRLPCRFNGEYIEDRNGARIAKLLYYSNIKLWTRATEYLLEAINGFAKLQVENNLLKEAIEDAIAAMNSNAARLNSRLERLK